MFLPPKVDGEEAVLQHRDETQGGRTPLSVACTFGLICHLPKKLVGEAGVSTRVPWLGGDLPPSPAHRF